MKELRIFLVVLMLAVLIAIPLRWEHLGIIEHNTEGYAPGSGGINEFPLERYYIVKFKIDRFANQGWVTYCILFGRVGLMLYHYESKIEERPISPGYDTTARFDPSNTEINNKAWRKRKAINFGMGAIFVLSFLLYLASFSYERRYLTKT